MRFALMPISALLLISCADEGVVAGGSAIALHTFDPTPSCWTPPPERPAETEVERAGLNVMNQFLEFNLSAGGQVYQLFESLILDDPTADVWRIENDAGTIEGAVIARSDRWAVIKAVAIFGSEDDPATLDATIDITPSRTVVEYYGGEIEMRADMIRWNRYYRGCHAASGLAFEIGGPEIVRGEVIQGGRHCWRTPSGTLSIPGVRTNTSGLTGGSQRPGLTPGQFGAADSAANDRLLCLQVIDQVIRW